MKYTVEIETADDQYSADLDAELCSLASVKKVTLLAKQHSITPPPSPDGGG